MYCPNCKEKMFCADTASAKQSVYRKYKCGKCGNKLFTSERVDDTARYELACLRSKGRKKPEFSNRKEEVVDYLKNRGDI